METFDRIIGYKEVKEELKRIADTLKSREKYLHIGARPPRGLLLYGEPGVGKTLMANCLIEASGRKCYTIRKDEYGESFLKRIKDIFQTAGENLPAIVFLDDIDKFANVDSDHCDADEFVTIQSMIDDMKDKDLFLLATANTKEKLPASLIRKGRFDRIVRVGLPSIPDAAGIINGYLLESGVKGKIDALTIAHILSNTSCAALETVVNEAGLIAGYERADGITMDHLIRASLASVMDTAIPDNAEYDNSTHHIDKDDPVVYRAYHEAGHIVIAEALAPGSTVLAMIVRKKDAQKGGLIVRGEFDNSGDNWENLVTIQLGGLAAVEQKLGKSDYGATHDLQQAFSLTREMMYHADLCGFHLHSYGYSDSERLEFEQERAVSIQIQRLFIRAKRILAIHEKTFDAVVQALLSSNYILQGRVRELFEQKRAS